jgi:hypothetical protein
MYNDLRDASEYSELFSEPAQDQYDPYTPIRQEKLFLGMTTPQRFVLSLLLLVTISVISVIFLLIMEKIWFF